MINFNKSPLVQFIIAAVMAMLWPIAGFSQATYKSNNSATARGNALGKTVTDNSNSGLTITKEDDKPTLINFPMIGVAKTVSTPVFQSNGSYNLDYTITVSNFGQYDLQSVQVVDALSTTFPSPMTFTLRSAITAGLGLTVNPAFNGISQTNLLTAAGSTLAIGQTRTITIPLNVVPNGSFGLRNNTATVTANTADGTLVSDLSHNATNPDGNGNGTPLDDATPTPVTLTAPDIEVVSKTVSKTDPNVGENVTFTITVRNNAGPAANVVVKDLLPAGYQYVSHTNGASYNSTTGDWLVGNLTDNSAKVLNIVAKVLPNKALSDYRNTATTQHLGDSNTGNNSKSVEVLPVQFADLVVTNTDGKTTYTPGTTNTYTFVVTNDGSSDAPGSSIVNTLPAGVTGTWTAVYAGGATGTASGTGSINQSVDIPSGGSVTYTYVVNVPSGFTGNFVNTGTATTATGITDPTPANNTATDTDTQSSIADLAVTKVASSLSPLVDGQITFTIEAKNFGPSQANGVTVTDLLSSSYTFVSANASKGAYNASTGIWAIGQLASGSTETLTIVATVVANQGNYQNQAIIAGQETDPVINNNTSSVTPVPVKIIDLAIAQTISTTTPHNNGLVTMTLTARNLGPSNATGVQVADLIKAGFTLVSSTPSKGTYDATTGIWWLGNLSAGETQTLVFTARVNTTASNSGYINTAVISGTETETTLANNTATVTVVKPPMANNDSGTTIPNTPVVIDILANDVPGGAALRNQTVTIITQPQHGTVTIDPATGKVTYTPALNYFGPDEFYYTVTDANGAVTNIAKVTIDIKDNPKIGVAKQLVSSTKAVNGSYNITYRLTVGNYGVAPLNQVSIKDDLRNTFLGHTISVTNIKSLGALQVNTAFNGATDIETLAANNSLAVGQKEQLEFTVNVTLINGGSRFLNIANAEGTSVTGLKTTDASTNGLSPDPNNDGNVSPSEPTPVDVQRPKEFIPGGFSPNGDGTNDRFVIENTGFKRLSLEVFNRWGNRVYRSNDYKNDWDGRCTEGISVGQDLPEGTYFYIVILDGKEKFVGHLTLKR